MRIFKKGPLTLAASAIILFSCGLLPAQMQSSLVVDKISVAVEGPQQVSKDAVLAHVKVRSGIPFDQRSLDLSIKSLYDTGLYETVEAKRSLTPAGRLDISLVVRPKYRIAQIAFRGNTTYSTARLRDQISSSAGGVLDERQIKRDADKIVEYYRKKGYSFADVKTSIERNDKTGTGAVVFDVNEGGDIKIQNINFTGNAHIPADDLLDQMKTSTWMWLVSYIMDYGRFKDEDFQEDISKLRQYYRNNGYLDVKIDESKIRLDFPDPDEPGYMDITIPVEEGRQYKTGKVAIKGANIYPEELLRRRRCVKIAEGDVFSPAAVDATKDAIRDYYGRFGYIGADVAAKRVPNLKTGDIDVTFEIYEGEKYYLESINIQGNTKTQSEVIIRDLALAPGDVFSRAAMEDSQARLKGTRFFDDVNLSPETTNIPNRRNLRIVVKEGRTGNVVFGAGFSTVESFVATAEVSQSNFDFLNYRNMFQGAGQKFRIRGSLGLETSAILLSFENPWIFNRYLSYGFDIFRTDSGYYSDYYSEVRTGMTHYFRKLLFENVEGRLGYTLEDVEIYDISKDAPGVIKAEQGHRSLSEISLSFLRETRDDLMMPTSGTRFEILQQVAGGPLMGQTNLYRVEARAGWWIPVSRHLDSLALFRYGNQVFSIVGRTGSVTGYGGKEVPFFEKYFLGGPYNLRGFKYRKVGPIDPATEEPEGGNTFGYISVEYSYQIIDPLRVAVFYDVGFVNADSWDWDPSNYNDDFGIGFRILLMGAPMRIDLGIPITSGKYNNDGLQFNFSFGTVF